MSESFVCSVCGQEHKGLPTDWAYKLPDMVWSIPAAEREQRAKFNDDLCRFGDRHFIRCILATPFSGRQGEFAWGIWAEVDEAVFDRYLDLYAQDGSSEPLHQGQIANDLPVYPAAIGMAVDVQFGDTSQRPSLFLRQEDDSVLANEQRNGIDDARFHEILAVIQRD